MAQIPVYVFYEVFDREAKVYGVGDKLPLETIDYIDRKSCPEIFGLEGLEICFSPITEDDYEGYPLNVCVVFVDELDIIEDKDYEDAGYITESPIVVDRYSVIGPSRKDKAINHPRIHIGEKEEEIISFETAKIEKEQGIITSIVKRIENQDRHNLRRPLQGGSPGLGRRPGMRRKFKWR